MRGARPGRPGAAAWLLLGLAGCVPPGTPQAGGGAGGQGAPLFAILCGDGGEAAPTMVPARAITVTPRAPGAELGWSAGPPGGEPGRIAIPPGQRCTIYRTF